MGFSTIRRDLGFVWFYLLSFFTSTVIAASDHEVGSVQKALSSHLLAVFLLSVPIVLIAATPFVLFRQKRWLYGLLAALACAVATSGLLYSWQVNAPVPTIGELGLAIAIFSGWLTLISLPAGLFATRR